MTTPVVEAHTRRSTTPAKRYAFHTFGESGVPLSLAGSFRDNIRDFLRHCAEREDYDFEGMPVWCTFLVHESRGMVLGIPLYTVEENVKKSDMPFCDYCRCAGWSHHIVSSRKYHLIIPGDDEWNHPLEEGCFDLQSHLLHGLIHCDGFGHLICINGIEGGSKHIRGREIMDLWDRICNTLHARRITVEDFSKKQSMELRLLYGVAYGNSWFHRWGYRFCHGSFGVKEHNYESAMDILGSMELDGVIEDFSHRHDSVSTQIKQIIFHYREMSKNKLMKARDLFSFMLNLKPTPPSVLPYNATPAPCGWNWKSKNLAAPRNNKCRKFSSLVGKLDSRWHVRRLEDVAEVIVQALEHKRNCGMTRQEVRDAARLRIGDTGLIDYVLKMMNNVIIGNYIVRRAVSTSSRVLVYTIQDIKDDSKEVVSLLKSPAETAEASAAVYRGRNIVDDLSYLYHHVLLGYPDESENGTAAKIILYSKHFVKDWPFRDEIDDSLRFICRVIVSSSLNHDILPDFQTAECVVVPLYSTVGDLKMAAQMAMRDTYCMMEEVVVTDIVDMEEVQDDELLFGIMESGSEIWVRAFGLDLENGLRYEGGVETWTVKCRCGAKDDDGERMVSCDVCETWQHTQCIGIRDADAVPRVFVCDSCCNSLAPTRNRYDYADEYECCMVLPELDMRLPECE